jgi:hypothetical protein
LTTLTVTVQSEAAAGRVKTGQAVSVRVGNDEFGGAVRDSNGHSIVVDFKVSPAWTQLGQAAQVIIKF